MVFCEIMLLVERHPTQIPANGHNPIRGLLGLCEPHKSLVMPCDGLYVSGLSELSWNAFNWMQKARVYIWGQKSIHFLTENSVEGLHSGGIGG